MEYLDAVRAGVIAPAHLSEPHNGSMPATPLDEQSRGTNNNYARADGQNLGNFITDRNSSRVLAPPGGQSQLGYLFGPEATNESRAAPSREAPPPPYAQEPARGWAPLPQPQVPHPAIGMQPAPHLAARAAAQSNNPLDNLGGRGSNNNYSRADGQNLGNFITDRNSSRVLAPPGGCVASAPPRARPVLHVASSAPFA